MSMLGAKTPVAGLPKGAFFDPVAGCVLVAPETVWENDLVSLMPLAKYGATFQTVFSFLDIRWALGSKNMWDPIITGWYKEGRGGRGTCGKEMLLKTGADCTGGKSPFYYKQVSFSLSFLLL